MARNNSKPGRPGAESWVLHADPVWSSVQPLADRTALYDQLKSACEDLTGVPLPSVAHYEPHHWGMASPADDSHRQVWMDRASGIALASDAYMGGRIEGAFLSGRMAAEALVGAADRGAGYQRTNPETEYD